jgi:hypothetical protein
LPPDTWSSKISSAFDVHLPDDVSAWFDDERPDYPLTTYAQPISPAELLDPASATVWGGLMLPDTLPILSDGGGNALCLRFASDGTVSEVIHWDHEGDWWKPYGNGLAEALVLDAAFSLIDRDEDEALSLEETLTFADWACRWIPGLDATRLHSLTSDVPNLLNRLRDSGVAPVAIAQRQCQDQLMTRLNRLCRQVGGGNIARMLGLNWRDFRRWLHEPELIPEDQKEALVTITTIPFAELTYQDWEGAVAQARLVLQIRKDLAWPFAVLGKYESAHHHIDSAADYYAAGLQTLGSTEDFVAGWSNWFAGQYKFIPHALAALKSSLSPEKKTYLDLFSTPNFARRVRDYWMSRGEQAEATNEYMTAYRCYYAAGWDISFYSGIEEILERLEEVATKAGSHAYAALARHHRLTISEIAKKNLARRPPARGSA